MQRWVYIHELKYQIHLITNDLWDDICKHFQKMQNQSMERFLNQENTFLHEEMIYDPIVYFDIRFVNLFKLLLEMQLMVITTVISRLM